MNSFAGSRTTEGLQKRDKEIEDLLSPPNLKLKGISANSQVFSAFYSTKIHPPSHKDDEDSISPSASDVNGLLLLLTNVWLFMLLQKISFHKLIG
jgi:hypothetical protein